MVKHRILIVEDDQELASAYQTRLEAEGFDVFWCSNGEDALAKTAEHKPDLILLDIMMPRISGYDTLDILRNTDGVKHIKIIVLSALSQEKDVAKAMALGANEYCVKSQTTIGEVVTKIRRLLGTQGQTAGESKDQPS